jgi:hypothetical protein
MLTRFAQPTRFPNNLGMPLSSTWKNVDGMVAKFTVNVPSVVSIAGHLCFQSNGGDGAHRERFWVGAQVTMDGADINGMLLAKNIWQTKHYEHLPINGFVNVDAGVHVVRVKACATSLFNYESDMKLYIKAPSFSALFVKAEDASP